ncbi:MAG: zinc ABC transporter substrate-binding protein [Acidobacteriota bacterium]|nr:zinc ABC transporter substrate-binding protein [Acidobacteriota bacterium]
MADAETGSRLRSRWRGTREVAAALTMTALVGAGCDMPVTTPSAPGHGPVEVVAAENFWGSIAAQVGGDRTQVTSVITNPATDPHSYEPTAADARAVASAALVIENGVGYDPWMPRLLAAASASAGVLDVGRVVAAAPGANPHRWYDPNDVTEVVSAYVADLSRLDPGDTAYFEARAAHFEGVDLAGYHALIGRIRAAYAGTPVGASESIFSMLAPALGLNVITPYSFLRAVSEGAEVSAADKSTIDGQIRQHRIRIYVYNSQNTTPDIRAQLSECRAAGIPTATITETMVPASGTYQQWQTAQLQAILSALEQAARR